MFACIEILRLAASRLAQDDEIAHSLTRDMTVPSSTRFPSLFMISIIAVGIGDEALAQGARSSAKVVSSTNIDEVVGGKKAKATTFEVTFPAGAESTPHRHPGPVFGYVLEGELEYAVGSEKPRILKAGDTFYEPAMILHRISRNPSATATTRVLAVVVHPRAATELVIPEAAKKKD
jgi:quercetin dioxygenase-like cupin family protein